MKNKKNNTALLGVNIILAFLLLITKLHAQESTITNPIGTTSIPDLMGTIIATLLGVVGSLSLVMFIYGGILWIISGGNEDNVKKGKETLKWAVFGIVIVFASYGILNFVIDAIAK
ncbi:MAG: pilin [Patescibacteria group bacterium]|nr:pilin [Patescibacteria group bacterium]